MLQNACRRGGGGGGGGGGGDRKQLYYKSWPNAAIKCCCKGGHSIDVHLDTAAQTIMSLKLSR